MFSGTRVERVQGGYDLALRDFAPEDSGSRARKPAHDTRVLCAAPGYLQRFGVPERLDDLKDHRLRRARADLVGGGGAPDGLFPPKNAPPRIVCDDGASLKQATIAGAGVSLSAALSVWR